MQSSDRSRPQHTADTLQSSAAQQDNSWKADTVSGGKAGTDSRTVGFSAGNSHTLSASKPDSCMDMSVDEHRNFVVEKPNSDSKTAEPKSRPGCLPHIEKQDSDCEMMEGSFRDESRGCHGDIVHSVTDTLQTSVAKADDVKSVDKPAGKTLSSVEAENYGKNDGLVKSSDGLTKSTDGLAKSHVHAVSKLNSRSVAALSFKDVARTAAIPEHRSNTSQVNDSFAYRDQSVVVIDSDDNDDCGSDSEKADDNADKGNDKTGGCRQLTAGTEAADRKQKLTLEAQTKDSLSKPPPESKPQLSSCEVSESQVCQPSTVITIHLPASASVKPVGTSSSGVDLDKEMAKRETISKLLNHKKVRAVAMVIFARCFVMLRTYSSAPLTFWHGGTVK